MKKLALAIPLALLLAGRATAQSRGGGRGESAARLPATRGAGQGEEGANLAGWELPPAGPLADVPSGDLIRSWSSADVREARQERGPDLEIVAPPARAPASQKRQPGGDKAPPRSRR